MDSLFELNSVILHSIAYRSVLSCIQWDYIKFITLAQDEGCALIAEELEDERYR